MRSFNPRPAFWPGATSEPVPPATGGGGFNPRPAFWPGATPASPGRARGTSSFNPRPAFWPGATLAGNPADCRYFLFQSSPGLLAGRYAGVQECCVGAHVSILARPFGRALLHGGRSPATVPCGFNPRPAFWPGATTAADRRRRSRVVSILARPFGRALLLHASPMHVWSLFQSSPGLLAGRYNQVDVVGGAAASFQSSPGLLAGRTLKWPRSWASRSCFNPRPAFWPGATWPTPLRSARQSWFQSSPGLLAGRTSRPPQVGLVGTVSILARPFGRALRFLWRQLARYCSFNPRPAFWPGATPRAGTRSLAGGTVSILARPFGRALPSTGACSGRSSSFQSSPGLLAGRVPGDLHSRRRAHGRFQSSPGLLAGRYTTGAGGRGGAITVSILARPFGRALRSMSTILPSTRCMFQSSPGLLAGRYPQRCVMMLSTIWFQSSPGLLAGR